MNVPYFQNFRTVFVAGLLFLVTITVGTSGYILIEHVSLLDGVYMTVITMATVGFREIVPLSDMGKIFTIFLILFSFGVFGYLATAITRLIVDGVLHQSYKDYKVKKKISQLENHVIVCGYGRNGSQACVELQEHNQPFIVIEKRDAVISKFMEDPNILYVQGDASSEEILEMANIRKAKALISALPQDADNMFVVLTASEMNPNLHIISRASDFRSDLKLRRAGASNVIMPDRIGGQRMAKLVTQPDVVEFIELVLLQHTKNVQLVELPCHQLSSENYQKTIRELQLREKTGANIIGVKTESGSYIFNPSPDFYITPADKLLFWAQGNR